jgi:hypothetical protein
MKTYYGYRDADNIPKVTMEMIVGRPLDPRLDLDNHSPTGFEWGYAGSGPAQLALALLADALGDDERALRFHQSFKFLVVARLPKAGPWTLTSVEIRDIVKRFEAEE